MFSRRIRKMSAGLAVGAMLFFQIVAAYACPMFGPAEPAGHSAAMHMGDGMPPCNEMDSPKPDQCIPHHQISQQSLDPHEVPSVVSPAAVVYFVDLPHDSAVAGSARSYSHALLTRVTAPPLTVRNCCLRI